MNRKILVVDDEETIRSVCAMILQTAQYEVDTASGISEAMGKLSSADYGLVLTDLRMGEDRGEDLIKMVKERSPETGVIVMTGYIDINNAVACMRNGAADYLPKPFEMDELIRVVERFFKTRHLENKVSSLTDIVGLYRITLAIGRIKPLDEVLDLILKTAEEQLSADGGSITLWNEDEKALIVTTASGADREKALGKKIRLGERVCGYAAAKLEPVIVNDELNKDARFRGEKTYDGVKSGISAPMILQDKLIGTLNLKRMKTDNKFTQTDLERAFVLAQIAALAISNSKIYEKMKEVSELKTKFLSNVSHELRTPLTAIKGAADLYEKLEKDESGRKKIMAIVKNNTVRMLVLVKDLLSVAEIERDIIKLTKTETDIFLCLANSIAAVSNRAEEKNIRIKYKKDKPLFILCDGVRMEQVFINILDNALKFSPEGSEVSVRVSVSGEKAEIVFSDAGPGIADEERLKVFDRFYQTGNSLFHKAKGFGLGLSIVKQLVDKHGGTAATRARRGRKKARNSS
ncbi:MAG: response regulator [Candidatus Omnitrophica bacterium]|nr:response regulator [Candidatus Omnitrophota bacterium]